MSNIAISELNAEAVGLDSDDLFLVSKYNETSGSHTSAKVKFKNLRTFPALGISRDDIDVISYGSVEGTTVETVRFRYDSTSQTYRNFYCSPEYTLTKTCWIGFGGWITIKTGQNIQLHTSISVKQNDYYDRLISWQTIRLSDSVCFPENLNSGYEYLPKGAKIRMIFNLYWNDGETPLVFSDYIQAWSFAISVPRN